MSTTSGVVRSATARVASTLVTLIVAFYMMPFLIDTLGDRWYGLWVIVAGFTGYYYLLDFGLSSATTRFVAACLDRGDASRINGVVNTALMLFAGCGLVIVAASGAVALAAGWFVNDPATLHILRLVILIQGVDLALGFPFKAFGGIVFAKMRYDLIEVYGLFKVCADAVVIVYFLKAGYGIVALVIIGSISHQVYNLVLLAIAKYLHPSLSIHPRLYRAELRREMFGYSVWSFVNMVSDSVRFKIDALVIGACRSASAVTHFAIAARLAEYCLTLIQRATNLLTPVFTRDHVVNDVRGIREKLLLFTRINTALGCFGGGLVLLCGHDFIARWMGPAYLDAVPVLGVLMVGIIVEAVNIPASNVLFAIAKHRWFAITSAAEAAANLGLSLILVGPMGIKGVAVGTVIPLVANRLVFVPLYACRCIDLPARVFYGAVARVALPTIGFLVLYHQLGRVVAWQPTWRDLLARVLLAVPLYLPVVCFTGFDAAERRWLAQRMFRRATLPAGAGGQGPTRGA